MAGRELRLARLTAGKTQGQLGSLIGHAKSEISRREHGRVPTMSVLELSRHAAAVGLRCHVRLYPAVRRPLDGPQLNLLDRLRKRIGQLWTWRLEVPIPIANDLRAADAVIEAAGVRVMVEAITRLADVQAQIRAAHLKQRDLSVERMVLLVLGSSSNRAAIAAASPMLREALPTGTRAALRELAAGRAPTSDALIVL